MPNLGLWPQRRISLSDLIAHAFGACFVLAWILMIGSYEPRPLFSSRFECGSDPWDFLRVGEILDPRSLGFIVESHCANAKYSPDGWIELRYGGGRVDIEVRRFDVGGSTYFQIVSIGGFANL